MIGQFKIVSRNSNRLQKFKLSADDDNFPRFPLSAHISLVNVATIALAKKCMVFYYFLTQSGLNASNKNNCSVCIIYSYTGYT